MNDQVQTENSRLEEQYDVFSNANWSAFVMAVAILSVFNSLMNVFVLLPEAVTVLGSVNLGITIILWGDFFYMLRKASDRRKFWINDHGWMALLGSMPFMRALRIIWFWLLLRRQGKRPRDLLARISLNQNAQGTLLGVLLVVLIVFQFAVVFILVFETPAEDGNIHTVWDAFWWAFVTVSTVGYGDKYPVTDGGRIVGFSLILVGIALFSVITGTLTQWFLGHRGKNTSGDGTSSPDREAESSSAPEKDGFTEIKHLLEAQAQTYQQGFDELNKRIGELEARLKEIQESRS